MTQTARETSITDIAREAQVSPATVSRVLNGTARVTPEKAARVMEAVNRLNFRLNSSTFARHLLAGKLRAVGVIIPVLHDEFFGTMITGIEERLRAHGVHMLCALGQENGPDELTALETLLKGRPDGVIAFADWLADAALIDLDASGIPVVVLNRSIPELAPHCLRLDNALGGDLATRHLLELGHTRVAHITGSFDRLDVRERYAGYHAALRAGGGTIDDRLEVTGVWAEEIEGGRAAVKRLHRRTDFTAVFAANDWLALGAVQGLRDLGLRVPEDVSVVGFDNRRVTELSAPAMTVIDFPRLQMGQLAADHLLAILAGEPVLPLPLLTPRLMIRGSTGPPPM
ncbi:LacI family transcriptional regulator [Deinococcus metalli]|uniref:LacI family transcriptional regulator n=1 Tax=Deinococcus metalli TaxID=1141878 RepID=A0A7W8KK38_9DEIO|nr:LacI family DNA-binding transcriptional regulator [Deinococcus metalli]MBB5377999.1 LacI family transcriptional regulator [Deinococcus metalli]GHF53684.1 LacI family transcriptional regulator [Deinococcus metalli]